MEAKKTFDLYKKVCPNSKAKYEPTPRNVAAWLMHIDRYKKNTAYSTAHNVKFDKQKMADFNTLIGSRSVESYSTAPTYIQEKIEDLCKDIHAAFTGIYEIYLEGSYAKGTFIDETTTEAEKAILSHITGKTETSDFDFSINGNIVSPNFDGQNDIIAKTGASVLIWDIENGFT